MNIEARAIEIANRIEELDREIHQSELNSRYGWECDVMKEEQRELERELTSLGY